MLVNAQMQKSVFEELQALQSRHTCVLRANSLAPKRLRMLTLASMRVRPSSFTTGITLNGTWMPSLARYLKQQDTGREDTHSGLITRSAKP